MSTKRRKVDNKDIVPSTPEMQNNWLRSRNTPPDMPDLPVQDPPSPSPQPRTSKKRAAPADSAAGPAWTQVGGITWAVEGPQSDNPSNSSDFIPGGHMPEPALTGPTTSEASSSGDHGANFEPSWVNATPEEELPGNPGPFEYPPGFNPEQLPLQLTHIDTTYQQVQPQPTIFQNPLQPAQGQQQPPLRSAQLDTIYQFQPQSIIPEYPSQPTLEQHPPPQPNINPSTNPIHLPIALPAHRIVTLPETNPDRPLQPGDEVHLLNDNHCDMSGHITYRISSIDPDGMYIIRPIMRTLRCNEAGLMRAPLHEGDIVSVFQPVTALVDGVVQVVTGEQVDWGIITMRTVVGRERRYQVTSWDERYHGRVSDGLRDGQLGQYAFGDGSG